MKLWGMGVSRGGEGGWGEGRGRENERRRGIM